MSILGLALCGTAVARLDAASLLWWAAVLVLALNVASLIGRELLHRKGRSVFQVSLVNAVTGVLGAVLFAIASF